MAEEAKESSTEQEPLVAQDANEVIEPPNERWWENNGPSGEVQ